MDGCPRQRGFDVDPLLAAGPEVSGLLGASESGGRGGGDGGEPVGVRPLRDLVEGGVAEPVEGERPDAVEQPVTGRATFDGELDGDQRAVGETTDDIGRRLRRHVEGCQDVLDPGERSAVGEAAECPQSALIIGEQQVIAPRDRRLEGALPVGSAAGRVTQQGEAVVQSSADLGDRQRPRPRRGELDRQREPVERSTHRLDGRRHTLGDRERGSVRGGSSSEQQDRVGERERCEGVDRLAVESERQLAGAQHAHPRVRRRSGG